MPWSTTIDTSHPHVALTSSPFVKTRFVRVIAACCLAPHQLIVRFVKVRVADGTFAIDRLPLAIRITSTGNICGNSRCRTKNISKLRGQESKLILEMLGGFENRTQNVDFVFALVTLLIFGASARRNLPDRYLCRLVRFRHAIHT